MGKAPAIRLIGAPTDSHSSSLRGAAEAPPLIRAALDSSHGNRAAESGAELGADIAVEDGGDLPLAEAAFRGALEYHPDYADAHYHLARLLDAANRRDEAARHWRLFMSLAPDSPWVDEARERIGEGRRLSAVGFRPDDG